MAERHIYGSDHKYKGSMDDDGRIYDAHHRFIGRVKNGTIYDDCNIPRGHINSDGRVTDMCNIPTGREFGANFEGWGGHGSGYVRNDVLGTGHGNDYGVFQQLDRHRHDSYSYDDDEDYDGDEDYGEEDVNKICREIGEFVAAAGGKYEIITDRVEAIKKAITLMDDDTILFLPGKGRETREKRGIEYIDTPSDADVVIEYM